MAKKFSLNDPNDGSTVKTNLIVDEAENKFHIENYQDNVSVKEILDANKVAQNEGAYKSKVLKEAKGYRVARLPNIVVHQLAKKKIISLTGKVLPVGGIKEKTIAARRSDAKRLILPKGKESSELYDLNQDPSESIELSKKYPKVVQDLRAEFSKAILEGRSTSGKPLQNDTPIWSDVTHLVIQHSKK